MDLRRKTRSSSNSSSGPPPKLGIASSSHGPPPKLGIASSSHAIKKTNVQQNAVAKSRKPFIEKWMVSTSPSSSRSVAKGMLKLKEKCIKMKEKCIISETEPKVGEQVDVLSNGKIDKGRVIKSCSVGYLIHYEGWSVMFDEWIKNVKSSKDIFVPKIVPNGSSGKKSKADLTNGAKDIKIIQIEDDKEKGDSVKGITRNNNSPQPATQTEGRPRGRPSKYRSQILQTPVSKVEAKSAKDDNLENEVGVRTRNQEKGGQAQIGQGQIDQEPQKTNLERRDSLSQMRTQGKREQEQETRVTDIPSSQLTRIQGNAPVPQQRGQEETKKQGTVPILHTRNQGKVPIPQERSQGKVPIPQERNRGKVPISQIRNQGRVPIIPQIRNQGKILIPQTGNQDKKFVVSEASNIVGNDSVAQTRTNVHDSQGLVPAYPGQHAPSLNMIGPAPGQPVPPLNGPVPGQPVLPLNMSTFPVPSLNMTGPAAADKAPFETPKALFKKDYTANPVIGNINGGFKTKENFWITNKEFVEKNILKNVKSENLVSENKVGFTNMSSFNGHSGRPSSFSCGQEQSKISSATASSMPFGFNKIEQFEKYDSTDEDDDDLTCNASSSCMATFWYTSELVEHLATSHGILDPGAFCRQRENKVTKINKGKVGQEREKVEQEMWEFKQTRQEESNNKNGGLTINLISPVKPTIKTESLSFTKVVSPNKALSQYEQIRENNIKERQELFIKLGIKESKEEFTPARRKSITANMKSTPTVKTPSEKRPVGFSMTNDLGSIRKSSRLKSKPEMNYSIMDPDSSSDNESQFHSDNNDDVWVEEKVKTPKKKTYKSWILKDKPQETNNDDLKQEEEKVNKNVSPKSVAIPETSKNEDHLKNVNDLKDLIPSLPTKREITKGYDSSSDDGGFYCSIDGCMESFWYENQLFEHMAYTHD